MTLNILHVAESFGKNISRVCHMSSTRAAMKASFEGMFTRLNTYVDSRQGERWNVTKNPAESCIYVTKKEEDGKPVFMLLVSFRCLEDIPTIQGMEVDAIAYDEEWDVQYTGEVYPFLISRSINGVEMGLTENFYVTYYAAKHVGE